jgi:hypothetical protein
VFVPYCVFIRFVIKFEIQLSLVFSTALEAVYHVLQQIESSDWMGH